MERKMSKVYAVGQISKYIANLVEQDFLLRHVFVKGEISNCKYHSMGHIYFTLKDENGSMHVLCSKEVFRGDFLFLLRMDRR